MLEIVKLDNNNSPPGIKSLPLRNSCKDETASAIAAAKAIGSPQFASFIGQAQEEVPTVESDIETLFSATMKNGSSRYNPIHKKIPVLIHDGKPIAESLVILEYIEETWPEDPILPTDPYEKAPENPILPTDPYEKAMAQFWAKFADDRASTLRNFFSTSGEEHVVATKESLEMLRTIEEQGLIGDEKYFAGERIGYADLAFAVLA
ncbi:glutathione S-transferase U24-like [Telopea speciosissima]|uniref:glutathione S-transferase U24-like n=1 Tax=Telopea speciosissima TaxID=54955 RepID=UPI001CC38E1E|nr:glutathione S-transferase U24-like [Telopea speciosissima]